MACIHYGEAQVEAQAETTADDKNARYMAGMGGVKSDGEITVMRAFTAAIAPRVFMYCRSSRAAGSCNSRRVTASGASSSPSTMRRPARLHMRTYVSVIASNDWRTSAGNASDIRFLQRARGGTVRVKDGTAECIMGFQRILFSLKFAARARVACDYMQAGKYVY
jgi:hypothetical protein